MQSKISSRLIPPITQLITHIACPYQSKTVDLFTFRGLYARQFLFRSPDRATVHNHATILVPQTSWYTNTPTKCIHTSNTTHTTYQPHVIFILNSSDRQSSQRLKIYRSVGPPPSKKKNTRATPQKTRDQCPKKKCVLGVVFFFLEMSFKDRSCSPVLLESGLKSFLGAGHNYPLINGKSSIKLLAGCRRLVLIGVASGL